MMSVSAVLATFAINALWQVGLLLAAAWAGSRLLRRAPALWIHRYWLAVAALCLVVSLLPAGLEQTSSPQVAGLNVRPVVSWFWRGEWGLSAHPLLLWLLAGYVFLSAAARFIVMIRAYRTAAALRRTARRTLPAEVNEWARQCQQRLGLTDVDLMVSPDVAGPATVGLAHPVVLLPEGIWNRHGREVVEAALAHEMVHVRRRDGLRKLAEELLLLPIAWHPLAGWLRSNLEHTRELLCDEVAARSLAGGRAYSRSLVKIAAELASGPDHATAFCSIGHGDLADRVQQLLAGPRRPHWSRLAACLVLLAAAALSTGLAALRPAQQLETSEQIMRPRAPADTFFLPPPPPPPPPPGARAKR